MADTLPNQRRIPPRILILSLLALAVPVGVTLLLPHALGEYGSFFWLMGLIPAFALSFYRGPGGVALALAAGVVTMGLTYVVAAQLEIPVPESLLWVVVAFLVIALWIAMQAEFLHRERDAVERMALTDVLTGLPNRRHAVMHLAKEFAAAQRGRVVTVVLFDLDQFKQYNDAYGHAAGDHALRSFGEVLAKLSRQMNLSGRLGGEEFLSVLGGADADGALVFANRVRTALKRRDLGDPPLTVSAGVASFRPDMTVPEDLLAAADAALYEAKRQGRDRAVVHTDGVVHPGPSPTRRRHRDARLEGEAPEEDPGEARATFEPTGFGKGRMAVVVEADPGVRPIIVDYLRSEGFGVHEATTSAEAFRLLSADVDVVISDLRLPGGGGPELVSAVKARWPAIQVVVTTGVEGTRAAGEALRAGADSYLLRPFGVPELRHHLLEALPRRDELLERATARTRQPVLDEPAQARAAQARASMMRGVMDLVEAAELRDPFRHGRSARVAAYARVLARGMDGDAGGLDAERLELACRVMDVGKIVVPDPILNKEGALTEAEMARVRTHPRVGRQLLAPLLDDDLILGVVNWHHERWDGSGYPDRLAGDAIPAAARVVALADTLDALTRPRAHRNALSWDDAIQEIREDAGRAFDPGLVEFMETVLDELRVIHDRRERVEADPPSVDGALEG